MRIHRKPFATVRKQYTAAILTTHFDSKKISCYSSRYQSQEVTKTAMTFGIIAENTEELGNDTTEIICLLYEKNRWVRHFILVVIKPCKSSHHKQTVRKKMVKITAADRYTYEEEAKPLRFFLYINIHQEKHFI